MRRHLYIVLIIGFNLLVISFCSMAQSNLIDVVYLKNGSIIRGIIVEQVPGHAVKLKTADGSLFVFESSEIEKMTREAQTTTDAAPSSPSPSKAAPAKDRDEWGRTYQQNLETSDQRKAASIGLLSAGSVLVAGGAVLIVMSADETYKPSDRASYLIGGIAAASAGIPLLGIGGGLWSAHVKYRRRADNMGGGTAKLNPAFIRTQSFSGVHIHAGSAVGLQFTYRF